MSFISLPSDQKKQTYRVDNLSMATPLILYQYCPYHKGLTKVDLRPYCVRCRDRSILLSDPQPCSFEDVLDPSRFKTNTCFSCVDLGTPQNSSSILFSFQCSEKIGDDRCKHEGMPLENVSPNPSEMACSFCRNKPKMLVRFEPCHHSLCWNCCLSYLNLCVKKKRLTYLCDTDEISIPCGEPLCEDGHIKNVHLLTRIDPQREQDLKDWKEEEKKKMRRK